MFTSRRITTMGGDKFRDEFSLAFTTDDYIETNFIPNYIHTNATMGMWVKFNTITEQTMGHHGSKRWYMGINGSAKLFFGIADAHTSGDSIDGGIVANKWFHFAVTAIDGTATFYIDGVAKGTKSYTQNSSNNPDEGWFMGARNNNGTAENFMEAKISEVFQYDVGLTASQVRTLYNGREPYNHKEGIASGNLKAWWRMGDGTLDKASLDRAGDDTGLICDEVNPTLGAELVSNGDFDDETNYSDYNMEGDDTADLSTEQVLVGSNSLKIDVDSSGEGTRLGGVATTTGKTYRISAWFYVTAGTAKINPGDGYWSPNALEPKTNVTNEWQQLVMYNTADQNSSNAWIYLVAGSSNSVFYLDNVSVREVQGNPGIFLNSDNQFSGDTP